MVSRKTNNESGKNDGGEADHYAEMLERRDDCTGDEGVTHLHIPESAWYRDQYTARRCLQQHRRLIRDAIDNVEGEK